MRAGDVLLAGSLFAPAGRVTATVLMHPGSGPSDRDNDVYFPPIREQLLEGGIAVCSFDKRGVGGSSGRWQDAGIVEQADDLVACLTALLADPTVPKPVGLFGHSQGGWVVVEAAGRGPDIAFVVTNSGPGVTPLEQERYSHRSYLAAGGVSNDEMGPALEPYDELLHELQRGTSYEAVRSRLDSAQLPPVYRELKLILFPDDEEFWNFFARIFDYDPRPALARIRVPVLALFGANDPVVPVQASVTAYRESVQSERLTVSIFRDADHRIHAGDPPRPAEGYLNTLLGFVVDACSNERTAPSSQPT